MFFRKTKPSIKSVRIPDWGWQQLKSTESEQEWVNPDRTMGMSLFYFDIEPDIPSLNVMQLRDFYRPGVSGGGGGRIEVEVVQLKGYPAVRTLFKYPMDPTGIVYVGSFTIPFARRSYVLRFQAPEIGSTGLREAMMVSKCLQEGMEMDDEGNLKGWFEDPYDPDFSGGLPMNLSEKREYDEKFPTHHLSILRKNMDSMATQIEFGKELRKEPRFIKSSMPRG